MVSDELTRELYAKINQLKQEKMTLHDLLEEAENCIDQLNDDLKDLQKRYDELEVDYIAAKSQL